MSATPIMLCVGGSRAETEWGLHDLSWKGFTVTLSTRMERNCGAETHAEYMALPKAEQDKRKDVGGFVGGSLRDGLRRRGCCTGRSLITLDMDNCAPGSTERSVVSDTRGAGNHTGSCCNIAADNRTHRQGAGRSSCGESHCRSV